MAYTFVAGTGFAASVNNAVLTTSAVDTTGADFIAIIVGNIKTVGRPTLSDSKGNTYTLVAWITDSADAQECALFYCQAPTVGSGHTFSLTNTTSVTVIAGGAFAGSGATPLDVHSEGADNAGVNTVPCGSITPAATTALVVSGYAGGDGTFPPTVNNSLVIPAGATNAGIGALRVAFGYLLSNAGALNVTWTSTGNARGQVAAAASFTIGGGGGGGVTEVQLERMTRGVARGTNRGGVVSGPFMQAARLEHERRAFLDRVYRETLRKAA